MTEKDMKKLNRYQLLELLILQSKQVENLQRQVTELQEQLSSRELQMAQVGSIAEASMQLGDIFTAAQKTADLYLDAVRERVAKIEADATREAEQILQNARQHAAHILAEQILTESRRHGDTDYIPEI